MIDTMDRIRDRLTDSVTQDQEKIKMEKKLAENRLKGIVDEMEGKFITISRFKEVLYSI